MRRDFVVSASTATATNVLGPTGGVVVWLRFVFGVGWGNPTSVQASGEPVQEKLSESVKLMVESGHADTVTVSLTVAWLQALIVVEMVCVGEVSVGEPALVLLVLPKSLAYFPGPLFRVMEV